MKGVNGFAAPFPLILRQRLNHGHEASAHAFEMGVEGLCCEHVSEQAIDLRVEAVAVGRHIEQLPGQQAAAGDLQVLPDIAEQLVHAVRLEDGLAGARFEVDAVVVSVVAVSIPIHEQGLHGRFGDETVDIEDGFEGCLAASEVAEVGGIAEFLKVLVIERAVARVAVKVLVDVADESTVIEIAGRVGIIAAQEAAVVAFFQHIGAEFAAIETDQCLGGPGGGDAHLFIEAAAELLAQQ